jgi:hypothetical protein
MLRQDEEIARILGTHRLDESDMDEAAETEDKDFESSVTKSILSRSHQLRNQIAKSKVDKSIEKKEIENKFKKNRYSIIEEFANRKILAKEKAKKEAEVSQGGKKYRKIFMEYIEILFKEYLPKLEDAYRQAGTEMLSLYKKNNALSKEMEDKIKSTWFLTEDILKSKLERWAEAINRKNMTGQ